MVGISSGIEYTTVGFLSVVSLSWYNVFSFKTKDLYSFQKAVKAGAVDRLTDTSKYTGSHKERFDESGKGKGKEGREDIVENTGYVANYKGKDTYDKKE